jgi:hemoglobin
MGRREVTTVFEAAGGDAGLLALAHAWHERCLADPVVNHPFSHPGHPQHLERLAAYWAEALGGPTAFTRALGDETSVLRMHAGNGEHLDMDQRAVACFDAALTDVGITDDPLRTALHDYFAYSTDRMARHPDSPDTVPDGEPLPHWSWDGPVDP